MAVEGQVSGGLPPSGSQANGPRRGVDGGRSRLRVDMSDGACQAGDQAEVEEKAGKDDDAAAVRCSRIEAAVCDGEVYPGSYGGWLLRCCCQIGQF